MTSVSNLNFTQEEMVFIAVAFAEERPFFTGSPLSPLTVFNLEEHPPSLHPFRQEKNCSTCSKTTAKHWYKDLSDRQKDLCYRCYRGQKRALAQTDQSSSNPSKKQRII